MHLFNNIEVEEIMEEELNLDNILGADEIDNLFVDEEQEEVIEDNDKSEKQDDKTESITEVDVDDLFTDKPESVGNEEDKEDIIEDGEDTDNTKKQGKGTSPNFYSSIAKALKDEGIFPDLDDESADSIKSAEDFRDVVNNQIKAGIEERQRRIDEALNYGVEATEIKKYENAINYLDSIKDEDISDESDKGETLRKQLIFQDFINRGYSKERAEREVNKSFNSGSDVEDAKEALNSNKEFFEKEYNELIKEAKAEDVRLKKEIKERHESLKKSILEDNKVFGSISVDKNTRKKILDNISKPIYKDPETGELFTAIQKYERENRTEFLKNIGLLFTLTDGFKSLDKLVKGKVKEEVKKGLRDLENVLNSTSRTADGNLKFVSGVDDDQDSNTRSWDLDI